VLNLIKHYAMKANGGMYIETHVFLTSALVGGEWSASHPGRFTSEERDPGTHWTGGWVGPGTCLDYVKKGKVFTLQAVASRYTAVP
jgi:hypothetical protein